MNMKRRNVDCSKLRRPLKRNKITEGIYGSSTFLYVKFLMVWLLVLMADFVLDFRFEYLWPFWLLLRSVYDSYKYQGLAFSVFFVCVAVTSDVICYLVIPVQWLFFAASTYVWVQYVWHTERGICLPTVSLWLLCVYIEASVRLRNMKPLPYHMDLCRPFAAHCIGYPVVTLGFGFKSYVSYRLRMRKQKEVERENNFYIQLLQQALPPEQQQAEKHKALPSKTQEEVISNGSTVSSTESGTGAANNTASHSTTSSTAAAANHTHNSQSSSSPASTAASSSSSSKKSNSISSSSTDNRRNKANNSNTGASSSSAASATTTTTTTTATSGGGIEDIAYIESLQQAKSKQSAHHSINDFDEETMTNEHNAKSFKASGGGGGVSGKSTGKVSNSSTGSKDSGKDKKGAAKSTNTFANNKDESISRLESDVKKLKADLQSSRNCEQELRSQINNYVISDKSMKSELYQLRQDNESLQAKLHNLVQSRQQDKQSVSIVERKLTDLRKEKTQLETQLATERRAKKAEEAATARAVAMATAARSSGECSDSCKMRRREQDNELKSVMRELKLREEQYRHIEREAQVLRQYKDNQNETEVLMSALAAMQEKNSHLENSLSSETRVKLDLFSALGEAKRQIEIHQTLLSVRDLEIADLKSKVAEVLALSPNYGPVVCTPNSPHQPGGLVTSHFSDAFACSTPPLAGPSGAGGDDTDMAAVVAASSSSLNPNASDYTPKV